MKLEFQIALLQEAKHGLIVGLQNLLESYLGGVMLHFLSPESMSPEVRHANEFDCDGCVANVTFG
jgi:hypothetical protein